MANLTEQQTFDAAVYELAITDPVMGGPGGVDNQPHQNLTNRTAWLKQQVDALIAAGMPVGACVPFFGGTVHAGFLKSNGAAVLRASYADLFTEIGTIYGAGDGATTFNLPDLRGEFLRAWDDGRGIDPGRALGGWQADAFRVHNHSLTTYSGRQAYVWNSATWPSAGSDTIVGTRVPDKVPAGMGSAGVEPILFAGAAGGSETRPRNLAVQFLIKY